MKTLLYVIIISFCFSGYAFAETCSCCGQEIVPVITTETQIKKDLNNRIIEWTEIQKADGVVSQKRVDSYDYYSTGEVKQIELKVYNGKDKLLKHKRIIHYKDEKQPIVKDIDIKEVAK